LQTCALPDAAQLSLRVKDARTKATVYEELLHSFVELGIEAAASGGASGPGRWIMVAGSNFDVSLTSSAVDKTDVMREVQTRLGGTLIDGYLLAQKAHPCVQVPAPIGQRICRK
jgi:hypothetical protein